MKKFFFLFFLVGFLASSRESFGWIYLWQANNEGDYSCCLHIGGADICNPHVRCTRYARHDLAGILDYVVRLLSTDRALVEPHGTILLQVKKYIREALHNPYYSVEYRLSESRSVRFYHEIIESLVKQQKENKGVAKSKSKQDQFVQQYLMKLGFGKMKK